MGPTSLAVPKTPSLTICATLARVIDSSPRSTSTTTCAGRAVAAVKLEGLSEYDVRRPLTRTGTNLLGLVRHLTLSEARYLGEIFEPAVPRAAALLRRSGLCEPRPHVGQRRAVAGRVIEGYQRACRHADATIEALPVDAPGFVPWWPRPDVKLFNVMVHVLTETNRHIGHADILREQLDGAVGDDPGATDDGIDWEAHRARVERAARAVR